MAASGTYLVSCQGSHTAYIRNNNITHVLNGDVYSSGGVNNGLGNPQTVLQSRIISTVYLKIGIVGLVIPARGATSAGLSCQIKLATATETVPGSSQTNSGSSGTNGGGGGGGASTSSGSTGSGSGTTSIVTYPLKHVPELLAWEFADTGTGRGTVSGTKSGTGAGSGIVATGMGLLLR